MNQADMKEAIRMIAADRGLSVDSLLQVLVEALATAYKKRPNAAEEVIVGLNPDTMDMTFTAYDLDGDGNWINERDDTPSRDELGRIAASTFRAVLSQRIREVEYQGKYDQFRNKEGEIVAGRIRLMPDRGAERKYLIIDMSGGEGNHAVVRAGAQRVARFHRRHIQGVHRRSASNRAWPASRSEP